LATAYSDINNMDIEKKMFGSTGHRSSRVIFGAAAFWSVSQEEADRTLELLLEYGVNHIDVAASYGDGEAEKRIGPWMERHRKDFFLATKTGMRGYAEARDELHSSLERLRVDSVDLIQLHNLVDPAEWEQAMGAGGALEALVEAREQGLTRYIGVTGHGLPVADMHLRSLERFPFDSVLAPYNYLLMQDPDYARSFERLRETCRSRNVALQTIKSVARRPWQGEHTRTTWYEPLEEQEDIDKAVHWVLGDPDVFLISTGDTNILPRVLQAAGQPGPRPAESVMENLARSRDIQMIFKGAEFIA
jgi:aryl-alcohol dehydrogenase-like predicted oxidoreductase